MKGAAKPRIGIFGAGWVGLVTGACFAELGHEVVVRDVIPERIAALQAGRVPLHEPELAELFERNRERLTFTLELDAVVSAPVLFVCVGTPPTYSGDADLSAVWSVVDQLPALEERAILVMKSTVPVGTGDKVRAALDARGLAHVGYVSNPEFLSEGSAVHDFMHPDRIVLGSNDPEAASLVGDLYAPLGARTVLSTDMHTAELIKYASNAFLATKISFINEIARIAEHVDADIQVVATGMGLDPRIGHQFLAAGLGFGGSCFPKDVKALGAIAGGAGRRSALLDAVMDINRDQRALIVSKLREHLGSLEGRTIGLLGLAFKPGTDDLREAPSLEIAKMLVDAGAEVSAYDPVAVPAAKRLLPQLIYRRTPYSVARGADAIVLVTEWNEFKELDFDRLRRAMRRPVLIDGRNIFEPARMRALGFAYSSIGRR